MEQFRIDTYNAIELYLRDPSLPRAEVVIGTFRSWPMLNTAQDAGLCLAAFDALRDKHGEHGRLKRGLRQRLADWIIRKGCPEWKPTWGDYWLLYWTLTKDQPGLAQRAMRALHRRGWHLPYADQPEWAMAQSCALRLIRRECHHHPEFQAAMLAEIRSTPCRTHDIAACP